MRTITGLVVASLVSTACSGDAPATLETDDQKASYAMGLDIGTSLKPTESHLDMAALIKGVEDAIAEREPAMTQEEIQTIMQAFSQTIQEEQMAEMNAQREENVAAGEAYMAENAQNDGVITTESGLQFEVLEEGSGPSPQPGQEISIQYVGTLPDGTEFDASDPEGPPARFQVDRVVPGFAEGLMLMKTGSKARLVIPGDLAYGPQGRPPQIGPSQTLIFEVDLIEVH